MTNDEIVQWLKDVGEASASQLLKRKLLGEDIQVLGHDMLDDLELREIPREPGFFAREDGTIWTKWINPSPVIPKSEWQKGDFYQEVLISCPPSSEYCRVRLYAKSWIVGHAILYAFIGPRPEGMHHCHFPDPNTKNNALSNLRWDTAKGNLNDTHRKIFLDDEDDICECFISGQSIKDIAEDYNVSYSTIYTTLRRHNVIVSQGARGVRRKISEESAKLIRERYYLGEKVSKLAKEQDVTVPTIYNLLKNIA